MLTAFVLAYVAVLIAIAVERGAPPPRPVFERLVLAPARRLDAMTGGDRRHVAALLAAAAAIVEFRDQDVVRMLCAAVPDIAGWAAMIETSTWIESLAAVATAIVAFRQRGRLVAPSTSQERPEPPRP